jgi:hypothetical protein
MREVNQAGLAWSVLLAIWFSQHGFCYVVCNTKEFPTVFSKHRFDKTPDHCPWDFTIELRPAALELNEKGYSLCSKEREAMEAWLK